MAALKDIITQFLEYIEVEKNRSQKTLENYNLYLHRFKKWALTKGIKNMSSVTQQRIKQYHHWLATFDKKNPLKKNTLNYHLIALRSLLGYCEKKGIKTCVPENVLLSILPRRVITLNDAETLERLLNAPHQSNEDDLIKKRDLAILELLFSTGMRVSELTALKRDDIHLSKRECLIRGKKDAYRVIHIDSGACEAIKKYLDARTDTLSPLFTRHDRALKPQLSNVKNFSLTPRSVQRLMKHYCLRAGLAETITPQSMRHSYAASLLKRGTDIHSVQSLLGHANVTTTHAYMHISNKKSVKRKGAIR